MRSIRRRLLIWLLPGLGLLWGAAGTAIYYSVKNGLETKLDGELRALVNPVRFLVWMRHSGDENVQLPGSFRSLNVNGFDRAGSGIYYQSWERNNERVQKSRSLEAIELKRWGEFDEHAQFRNLTLANGDTVRAVGFEVRPPFGGRRGGSRGGGRFGPNSQRSDRDHDRKGPDGRDRNRPERFDGPDGTDGLDRNRPDGLDGRDRFGREGGVGPRGPERGPDEGRFRPERSRPDWDDEVRKTGQRIPESRPPRGPDNRPDEMDVIVARSRTEIDQTLALLLGGISFTGLVAALASTLLIRLALQSGLTPLRRVGEQARTIDASSLQARFPTQEMPIELRPIADALNGLLGRIESSFERERRFSADLAHELRTPVAELKSMAEVAMKWPEQADPENYVDVRDISDQMQATIENLLMLARLEKGTADGDLKEVALGEFVRSVWQPFVGLAKKRELDLKFEIAADRTVEIDDKLLRLILSNLLSNAAEYAPQGSAVECRSEGDTILSVRNPAGNVTREELPHVFERLWRHDQSRTDATHSGLGLSLAKSCAEALQLELTAVIDGENHICFRLARK
jgi:signal transduction histidine kinase